MAFVAVGSLAAGVANAQTASTPTKGGTAVVALGSEPQLLNAAITTATQDFIINCNVYEGLVVFNLLKNQFEPALAESWTVSPDGKTYTFKLRKATWHDGKPFTSEDVRYTLMEVSAKTGPIFAGQAGKVLESVNPVDPQTVEIKMKEPYGPLLLSLTCPLGGAILPSHIYKGTDPRTNPATTQKPIGTGPFKFSEWTRGSHVTFVRNDAYWNPAKPYLDSVIFRTMSAPASRTQALLAGEVDYVSSQFFPPSDGPTVEANPRTKRELTGQAANMLYAFFNLKRKPLDDVRVRHALLTATDRDYIFKNAFFGLGRPGQAPWTTTIEWAHDPSIHYDKSHPFNPAKAAQMLDEAGYKADANGIRLRLSIVYDAAVSERNQTAAALKAMWRQAGVDLTVMPLESAVLVPRVHQEGNFDVYMSSYNSYMDPTIGVARAFITSSIGVNFGNAGFYSNPEVDALFDKAGKLTTLEERGAVYKQLEVILMRDLPSITLHENRSFDAANKKLMGGWGYAGNVTFGNAWLAP